MTTLYIEGDPR